MQVFGINVNLLSIHSLCVSIYREGKNSNVHGIIRKNGTVYYVPFHYTSNMDSK